jgi:MFS family permease
MLGAYREIPGKARLLIYLSFFPSLALSLIYTDLSYFLTRVQGLSTVFTGVVLTTMGLTVVAMSIPIGILADRYGRRKFLAIGNLLASLTLIIFAVTTNPVLLIFAAITEGTTEAAFATSGTALLTTLAGDTSRTAAFSLSSFLQNIAYGLGGFALPLVIVLQSFGMGVASAHVVLYVVVALIGASVTPLLLRLPESARSEKAKTVRQFLPSKSKNVLLKWSLANVMVAFGAGLFVPLMPLWFSLQYSVPDTLSGPVIGISGFLIALVSLVAPFLARKFGLVRAAVLSEGLSMIFMFFVPLSPTFLIAGFIYTVRSFLMNVANPMNTSLIMGLVSPDERGAAAGISSAVWRLPNSISTTIGADMMNAGLLALPFYLATGLYVASLGLYWFFFGKTKLPEESAASV